jgi:hypothetical protein
MFVCGCSSKSVIKVDEPVPTATLVYQNEMGRYVYRFYDEESQHYVYVGTNVDAVAVRKP